MFWPSIDSTKARSDVYVQLCESNSQLSIHTSRSHVLRPRRACNANKGLNNSWRFINGNRGQEIVRPVNNKKHHFSFLRPASPLFLPPCPRVNNMLIGEQTWNAGFYHCREMFGERLALTMKPCWLDRRIDLENFSLTVKEFIVKLIWHVLGWKLKN